MNWSNKEEVFKAVQQDGLALKFADKKLQADKDVVMVAVLNNGLALEFADKSLKEDKDIIIAILATKRNKWILSHFNFADNPLRKNEEFLLEAIKLYDWLIKYFADISLQSDKKFVLKAVGKNGNVFWHLIESFRYDEEIVSEAIKNTPIIMLMKNYYIPDSIKEEKLQTIIDFIEGRQSDVFLYGDKCKRLLS